MNSDMQLSASTIETIYKDIVANIVSEQEEIFKELLTIGEDNYKDGYGALILAIQEKYILVPKRELKGVIQ